MSLGQIRIVPRLDRSCAISAFRPRQTWRSRATPVKDHHRIAVGAARPMLTPCIALQLSHPLKSSLLAVASAPVVAQSSWQRFTRFSGVEPSWTL